MQIRCEEHGPPDGRKYDYVAAVEPVSYPATTLRCARSDNDEPCHNPALLYLDRDEYEQYQDGQRVFGPPGRGVTFKVSDEITRIE